MKTEHRSTALVTGAAGFIGFWLSRRLLGMGYRVVGLDNLNDYYDVRLKQARLQLLKEAPAFTFSQTDLKDKAALDALFDRHSFDYVINLAAQAGVRYSITNPYAYLDSNIHGFLNVIEACRNHMPKHFIFASSSSVYGGNKHIPFSVQDNVDHPLALYAASKRANELMAHSYANLYKIPSTGLRFFSVYGPYGRPDMALFLFTKAILEGRPIDIYNYGKMKRDFTYVEDIVDGIVGLLDKIPTPDPEWYNRPPDPATSFAPFKLYNIGNDSPIELLDFIELIEKKLGKQAIKNFLPMQQGDVPESRADVDALEREIGFRPKTSMEEGIGKFVDWYLSFYSK